MDTKNLALYGIGIVFVIILVGFSFPKLLPFSAPYYAGALTWLIIMLLMMSFIALLGKRIHNRYGGVFINERNKMTLSRFQLVIWTVIVLSAFVTIALARIASPAPTTSLNGEIYQPLKIALPPELWELLGISTAALVGSPLVLGTKLNKKPTPDVVEQIAERAFAERSRDNKTALEGVKKNAAQVQPQARANARSAYKQLIAPDVDAVNTEIQRSGTLASNDEATSATFSDMFRGDEKVNDKYIDVAKVQMFFFTILIAFSYAVLLIQLIIATSPSALNNFPALDNSSVALLGISSGGYLASKAVDHTKTEK